MAGLQQLAKLTTRGMRLEPGSGGTGGLKWDDVAAGLRGWKIRPTGMRGPCFVRITCLRCGCWIT